MKKRLIMALLLVGLMVVVYQNGIGIGRTFAKKEISNALNEIDDEINEAREDSKGKRVVFLKEFHMKCLCAQILWLVFRSHIAIFE